MILNGYPSKASILIGRADMALVARKPALLSRSNKYKVVNFDCAACGKPYIFVFNEALSADEIALWLEQRGWPIIFPPLQFFCDDGCKSSKAKPVEGL
jgi:hypothetical protein